MGRWSTIAATALVSLAWAGCGSDGDQRGAFPAPEAQQAQAAPSAEALREAVEILEETCVADPVPDEGEEMSAETSVETSATTDAVVDEVIRAFYLAADRPSGEDDVREALGLLSDGCASPATAQRLAMATGVDADADPLEADDRPEGGADGAFDCDAQGINAREGAGGTCVSAVGQRVTVADRGETATTPALEARLLDVKTPRSLRRGGKKSARANGVFVVVTLEVRNRLKEPVEFDPAGQVELYLEGQPYFSVDEGTTTIESGEWRKGTVAFDVPKDVAGGLDTNGNVFVQPFAEAGFEGEQATIAVLRTYK